MSQEKLQTVIRTATGDDLNFIYSTWLKSYEEDSCFGRMSSNQMFANFYRQIIDKILQRQDTKVLIATLEDEPLIILSYIVIEPGTLHYIYTKSKFRQLGLAQKLFSTAFSPIKHSTSIKFTHQTRMVRDILSKYNQILHYRDALIFKGDSNGPSIENKSPL